MHTLANSKGFILLDMLSRRIGRVRFASILRQFIRQKTNHITSWQEFQRAIESGAREETRWLFEQWFERRGAPDYLLTWKQEGRTLRGVVSQTAPYYRAALEVEIRGSRRSIVKTIEVAGRQTTFNWVVPFEIESVTLDPHYKVLRRLAASPAGTNTGGGL